MIRKTVFGRAGVLWRTGPGRRRGRGAAAVETAIVLPLLLFVLFGLIDFGRLLNAQLRITEAAREGARAAVLAPTGNLTDQQIDDRVRDTAGLDSTQLPNTEIQIVSHCDGTNQVAKVTVTNGSFSFVTPAGSLAQLFGATFVANVKPAATGVMNCAG